MHLVEGDVALGVRVPPVERDIGLQLATVFAHERAVRSHAQPRQDAARTGATHAGAVRLVDVALVVVDVDQLRLRFDDPAAAQRHGIADLARHRQPVRAVLHRGQLVAFHAVAEPAVLEPCVGIGAVLLLVVLVPGAVDPEAPALDLAFRVCTVGLRLGIAAGVAVAAHHARMQAARHAARLPRRQLRAALQQERIGAGLEHAILATPAFPLAHHAQPARTRLALPHEAHPLRILRLAAAIMQAMHEHLARQALIGKIRAHLWPIQRTYRPGHIGHRVRRRARSGARRGVGRRRRRVLLGAQVPGLRRGAVDAAPEQPVFIRASHRAAVDRERTGLRRAAVDRIDELDAARARDQPRPPRIRHP
ncbi:hypothetical protein D3C72_1166670 [compost metagenome]